MPHSETVLGRKVVTQGARIAGLIACVPQLVVDNSQFREHFSDSEVADVVKIIGVQERRWADAETTTSDLCFKAAEKLLLDLEWDKNSIDAVIFVSQTPDFRLPATACTLQSRLGISRACIALDINLGCSGYPYALWLAMTMIQTGAAHRVLLAVGDTISKVVDKLDRSTALLFGDAGTVTALEGDARASTSHFILGADGFGAKNLVIPQGAYKNNAFTGDQRLDGKNPFCLFMDGGEIFNFTLKTVPGLVSGIQELSGSSASEYDSFLFHQANLFMLKHLSKKAKLPEEKVPLNIQNYGNTSCASIPLLMATNLSQKLSSDSALLAMFGFGVGYSWGAASIDVGPLKSVGVIEF